MSPQREKSGRGPEAARPARLTAPPSTRLLRMRLDVLDRNAAVGSGAGDAFDPDAELARHPPYRRRRRSRRRLGGRPARRSGARPRLMATTLLAARRRGRSAPARSASRRPAPPTRATLAGRAFPSGRSCLLLVRSAARLAASGSRTCCSTAPPSGTFGRCRHRPASRLAAAFACSRLPGSRLPASRSARFRRRPCPRHLRPLCPSSTLSTPGRP